MMKDKEIYCSNNEILYLDFLYSSGEYFTYEVYVKSGKFSGVSNFCIAIKDIQEILTRLKNIVFHEDIIINDCESNSYINFKIENYGHVLVKGQIGSDYEKHMMKFEFLADQTILSNLRECLKSSLN